MSSTVPENDPKLHTLEGIEDMLDEMSGEMGMEVEWGWVELGTVYRPRRSIGTMEIMPRAQDLVKVETIKLCATVTVDQDDLRRFLIADAERALKPGERFELRRKMPYNYGRTHGMAWYRNDAMDKRHTWGRVPKEPTQKEGYLLVGEYTVPTS